MQKSQEVPKVFALLKACQRHGHHPTEIHVTLDQWEAIYLEVRLPPPLDATDAEMKAEAERHGKARENALRGDGGTLVGLPCIVHPNMPSMWVHADEVPQQYREGLNSPDPASPS